MIDFELELLTKYVLLINRNYVIGTLIILGYFSKFKDIFAKATILLLFSMIFNKYLKSIWQIPLNHSIGREGWAFPSGHMQVFITFYGYLAWRFRSELTIIVFIIIAHLVAFSLVHLDYHNYYDVLAACYFGILTIVIYEFVLSKLEEEHHKLFIILIIIASINLYYLIPKFFSHALIVQSALIGFSLGWIVNKNDSFGIKKYIINIISALAGSALIYCFNHYITGNIETKISIFLMYFSIGLWISYGVEYINNKFSKTI